MPSFDIISEVDKHELQNAVDQTKREIETRFDFKGITTTVELNDNEILLGAPSDFQVKQIQDIMEGKMVKRGIDPQSLDYQEPEINIQETRQKVVVKQGIDQPTAKKITKTIKESKLKVQAQIQGDKVRIVGKKRDDLQEAIALLKDNDFGLGLQYDNFRD
jgi:uncharacterized protein YajQ (UPF0234 family)